MRGTKFLSLLKYATNYKMLKQFVPWDYCLKCLGCCRFAQSPTIWAPSECGLIKDNSSYACEHLNPKDNRCKIYARRPLDCQLYPFLLVRRGNTLQLGLHKSCCFIQDKRLVDSHALRYAEYLKRKLQTSQCISLLRKNPKIAADYQADVEIIRDLPEVFIKALTPQLKRLSLKNKSWVERYLKKSNPYLSAYHFASIFIWKDLFRIFWTIINTNLCIFYQDGIGVFMPLAPLGKGNALTIKKCFEIMNTYNENREISRIENIPEKDLALYTRIGLKPKLKDTEYICARESLVMLPGDSYKHKRSSYNYFVKNYNARVLEYKDSYYRDCLKLYQSWSHLRKDKREDIIYQQMLEDSFLSFQTALRYYQRLGLSGYVVKINGTLKACTFGYPLNKETFCVLFEICDLNFKGIAQYIFREFCKRLSGYKYINIMGASDLENLKTVKLSYRPKREIGVYNIYQK